MSEITGDESTKGNIKCRLSIPHVQGGLHGLAEGRPAGRGPERRRRREQRARLRRVPRVPRAHRHAPSTRPSSRWTHVDEVKAFCRTSSASCREDDCMREATYIRAERFDLATRSPLKDESPEEHAAFLAEFKQLQARRPLRLPAVGGRGARPAGTHFTRARRSSALLQVARREARRRGAKTMDMEEFHDFVIDVGLETKTATRPRRTRSSR